MDTRKNRYIGTLILGVILPFSGCKKLYNLPEETLYLSPDISYTSQILEPVLGRMNILGSVSTNYSSLPITFEIKNPRYGNGKVYNDLFQVKPTYVWDAEYTGNETTLEEIESKRHLEDHPLFEVDNNGNFILWPSSNNELIEPRSIDGEDLTQNIRYFDLKISNSQGSKTIKDFQFLPWRERPYDPYTDIDPYTGELVPDPLDPSNPNKHDHITPSLSNVVGEKSNEQLVINSEKRDVVVYIKPFEGGNGHNLRFKFLNTDSLPINPAQFNETKWDNIIHGFNKTITDKYVQYDVAYPIPLTNISTKYSSNGNASVNFSYSRLGYGGILSISNISLEFKIFHPGDWEIVFHFINDNPKFEDD
ncbi:protein of unknown function [bacterium A37T11]|nr:protein of unknown function [bacterium A37T11]